MQAILPPVPQTQQRLTEVRCQMVSPLACWQRRGRLALLVPLLLAALTAAGELWFRVLLIGD
jgi:hypothetical protein